MFFEVNRDFGLGLYNSFSGTFFYIILFVVLVSVVSAVVRRDNVFSIVFSILCFALVMYLFMNPFSFIGLGSWVCDLIKDVFVDLFSDKVV